MITLTQVINRLTELGCDPTGNDKQWSAKCPAHDDRNPSLSISEGDDGRALLYCHAKCDINAICMSLGYELSDLMPDNTVDVDSPRVSKAKPRGTSSGSTRFSTAEKAIERFETKNGPTSGRWSYQNSQGEVVGVILRRDTPKGKDICSKASVFSTRPSCC
jgi:putative DNA primase/helicase